MAARKLDYFVFIERCEIALKRWTDEENPTEKAKLECVFVLLDGEDVEQEEVETSWKRVSSEAGQYRLYVGGKLTLESSLGKKKKRNSAGSWDGEGSAAWREMNVVGEEYRALIDSLKQRAESAEESLERERAKRYEAEDAAREVNFAELVEKMVNGPTAEGILAQLGRLVDHWTGVSPSHRAEFLQELLSAAAKRAQFTRSEVATVQKFLLAINTTLREGPEPEVVQAPEQPHVKPNGKSNGKPNGKGRRSAEA